MKQKGASILINIVFAVVIIVILILGSRFKSEDKEKEVQNNDFLILEKDSEISALYSDGKKIYVGTNEGIHIYDAASLELLDTIDNIRMIYTASIISDGEGGIFVGHEDGLTHIDSSNKQTQFAAPQIPEGRVNTVAIRDGILYCGTYNGAAVLEKESGKWTVTKVLGQKDGLYSDSVNVILPVESGIFFGSYLDTQGGLTYVDNDGNISYYNAENGLIHPYVTSMIEDSLGYIWVGTGYMRDGGLFNLKKEGNTYVIGDTYTKVDGIPGEKVRFLFMDDKSFWITTEYDGVLVKKQNSSDRIYLNQEMGLSDNEIKCIIEVLPFRREIWTNSHSKIIFELVKK